MLFDLLQMVSLSFVRLTALHFRKAAFVAFGCLAHHDGVAGVVHLKFVRHDLRFTVVWWALLVLHLFLIACLAFS